MKPDVLTPITSGEGGALRSGYHQSLKFDLIDDLARGSLLLVHYFPTSAKNVSVRGRRARTAGK